MSVPSLPVKQPPSSIVRRSLMRKGFQAWESVPRTRGLGACSHDACFHPVHPRLADHVLSDAALPLHLYLPRVSGCWRAAGPWVSGCQGQQVPRDPFPVAWMALKDPGGKGFFPFLTLLSPQMKWVQIYGHAQVKWLRRCGFPCVFSICHLSTPPLKFSSQRVFLVTSSLYHIP